MCKLDFIGLHTQKTIFYRGKTMNLLNEKIRILKIQIEAEEMQPKPNIKKLKRLRKERDQCLKNIMKG